MKDVALRPFRAEDKDWLVEAHARLYAEDEGFDHTFGPLVEGIIEAYLADHDPARERGFVADDQGTPLGSIFCVKGERGSAKLRLFLVLPEARGQGLGRRLLDACTGFARKAGYTRMTLWTHESHRAACALYASTGWRLVESRPVRSFGVDLIEQAWEIDL